MTHEKKLIKSAQMGDNHAKYELVERYKILIRSHAFKFVNADNAFELEDLVNVASDGFIMGVQNFDTNKELMLPTYVTYWIKKFLRESVASGISTMPYDDTLTYYKAPIFDNSIPFDNDQILLAQDMLLKLPKLDKEIVKCYFGIDHDAPMSLEEIADSQKLDTDIIEDIIQDSIKFLHK